VCVCVRACGYVSSKHTDTEREREREKRERERERERETDTHTHTHTYLDSACLQGMQSNDVSEDFFRDPSVPLLLALCQT